MVARDPSFVEFVGREGELAVLRGQLADACAGRGSVALLAGEPGIGKTRTAEELAAEARLRGARVLWGRCYEGEGAPAYWPWVQVIRAYVRDRDPDALDAEMGSGAADIAEVVPEVRERLPSLALPPPLEPAQARFRLFDSITSFLIGAASRQSLVLILDDLHWADTPSLLLLQFLARELRQAHLLLVGTYRDVEVGGRHTLVPTLAELARERTSRRIYLRGLAEQDVARFIKLTAGLQAPTTLVAAVTRETEGNPFFVTELVRLLAAEGRLEQPEGMRSGTISIPPSVREVIGRRLDRLTAACNDVLALAAVLGREFALGALEGAGSRQTPPIVGDAILAALEEAEMARVIRAVPGAPGRYIFTHVLIRETLYDALPSTRAARLHRHVGEALEALYAGDLDPHPSAGSGQALAELAHHFCRAAPGGDVGKAVMYAQRAGEWATALLAYEEAAEHYGRALQALELQATPDQALRCDLLLALGEAQVRAGETDAAREAFREAADLARSLRALERLARAALGLSGPRATLGAADVSLVSLLKEALEGLGDEDGPLRARVLGRLAVARLPSDPRKRTAALSGRAVQMARRVGDPAALADTLDARHLALWPPEHAEERLAVATEIVRLAEETGNRELALRGHGSRLVDLLELGQIEAVDRELELHTRLAEELRQPSYRWQTAVFRAMRSLLNGDFAEAERLAQQALLLGRRLQAENALQLFGIQLFWVRREQGRLAELEGMVADLAERHPEMAWALALAFLYADLGRETEARRAFERLAADDFADLTPYGHSLMGLALVAETCARIGDAVRAALLYKLLLPYHERYVLSVTAAICRGSAAHFLGLLAATMGRWGDAGRHFETALEGNARIGARPWLAHTECDYASLLLARGEPGDHAKARELLAHALECARELGMTLLEARVRVLTKQLGRAHPQAVAPGGQSRTNGRPDGLTHRQVEVLRLLAGGRTNKEIADELALSVRTVEHHVEHIYGKIGARGRADAVAYSLRHGLLSPREQQP